MLEAEVSPCPVFGMQWLLFFRWELLMVMLIIYTCVVLPPRIAFGGSSVGPFFVIDAIVDVAFLIDIMINFQSGQATANRLGYLALDCMITQA